MWPFLWHFKYYADANNRKQIIHMHARTTSNKHTNTHLCNSQTPFMCGLIICEPLWLSVNTFYASIGTDTMSSHSKWFYKQFTEAWCLLTWNPLPLSLTYYHWYNLFSGNWSIDQWSHWFILLLTLKMCSHSLRRAGQPYVYVLWTFTWTANLKDLWQQKHLS